jgi:hypothetical protein
MTPEDVRRDFDDLDAGFVYWERLPSGDTVVACSIWATSTHQRAWIAFTADDRRLAAKELKRFGVHGLKFDKPPSRLVLVELVACSATDPGRVVFRNPDGLLSSLE